MPYFMLCCSLRFPFGKKRKNKTTADHFYPTGGIKGLKKFHDLSPDLFKSVVEFATKVFEEGALTMKATELIAVAIGQITQ